MPKVISLARYWNKVLASPVRNQTLIFSDADMPGHRERMAAFASVAERWFGQVLFLEIPSKLTNVLQYFGMSKVVVLVPRHVAPMLVTVCPVCV